MADTGKKHYSLDEAINRIVRALIGKIAPNDAPGTLAGSILSVDEALSKLAEILEGNDPEEPFTLPTTTEANQLTIEDLTVNDSVSARTLDSTEITAGTGTFYAGYGNVSIGGFSAAALFGKGQRVFGFAPADVRPSGTLSHLGGVAWVEGGALMYLGASGTITTLAGS